MRIPSHDKKVVGFVSQCISAGLIFSCVTLQSRGLILFSVRVVGMIFGYLGVSNIGNACSIITRLLVPNRFPFWFTFWNTLFSSWRPVANFAHYKGPWYRLEGREANSGLLSVDVLHLATRHYAVFAHLQPCGIWPLLDPLGCWSASTHVPQVRISGQPIVKKALHCRSSALNNHTNLLQLIQQQQQNNNNNNKL